MKELCLGKYKNNNILYKFTLINNDVNLYMNGTHVYKFTIECIEKSVYDFVDTMYSTLCDVKLSHIVATDNEMCIGRDNKIPWSNKHDMSNFKKVTTCGSGKYKGVVIMGRNTHESLPNGYLSNRLNIVLSTKMHDECNTDDIHVVSDLMQAIFDAKMFAIHNKINKVYIIGGASLYNTSFKFIDYVDITYIDTCVDNCDTYYKIDDIDDYIYQYSNSVVDVLKNLESSKYITTNVLCDGTINEIYEIDNNNYGMCL